MTHPQGPQSRALPSAAHHGRLLVCMPAVAVAEDVQPLVVNGATRIERIVSTGQASPAGFWYDQEEDEFVLLGTGAARLAIEGRPEPVLLEPGDWVNLPAQCRHRVEWTSAQPPTV